MAIIYNTNYTHNPNAYLTLAVERAAKALFGDDQVVLADNIKLAEEAGSGLHDTLICIDGQRINIQLMRRVRPAIKTMILWTFEDPFMLPFNLNNASLFDFIFTNDPGCVEAYRGKGHYLPLAASHSIHARKVKQASDLDYDLFFAGTMWPNRVATLRRVISAFPDARLKLVCPGNDFLPPLPSDLADRAIQRPISLEAFVDFANASAVTLAMFRDYASHGDVSQATAPGPRLFELALAGTAQVIEAPGVMEDRYFATINGAVVVRDTDSVVAAIDLLLRDEKFRHSSAVSSQESVMGHHLYEHRLQEMARITGANFGRHERGSALAPRRNRLRVLMCTHSTIYEQAWGGVEVYQQTLCAMMGREVEFYFWLRRGTSCRLTTSDGHEVERYDVAEIGWTDALCDASEEMAFSNAISQYNFDIVHFQHLGHHALSLPMIAKASGAGTVFSAHDFWLISSRYNLLNHDLRYDEGEVKSVVAADIIFKNTEGIAFGGEQTRRAFVSRMLRSVDVLLFGTQHSKNLIQDVYPQLQDERCLVLGIPSPETTFPVTPKPYAPLEGRPLGVAIVGNFLRTKGADAVLSLIEAAHPEHFLFHIFGYVQPEYEAVLRSNDRPNVRTYGRYNVGDTASLQLADVALNLSIWPETYCISLSEAWQNGLVPIVTDIGALGDRVSDGINGFKVPVARPDVVLERLELLRASEGLRHKMMANISPNLWTHAENYAASLLKIYENTMPQRSLGVSELQIDCGQIHVLPHSSWREQAPPRHIFDPPTNRDLAVELPEPVYDWTSIQGAEFFIDDVCHHNLSEQPIESFVPANEFHIRGWYVLPGVSSAGSLYVVLLSDGQSPPIFIQCMREGRSDVVAIHAAAPRRSGFSGQVALRGKWCEGTFRLGIVNIVNGAGAFMVTPIQVTVDAGRITRLMLEPPSNQTIESDFDRVASSDGLLRDVKLHAPLGLPLHCHEEGDFEYFFDQFDGIIGQDECPDLGPNELWARGWAFCHRLERAGDLYFAFVSTTSEDVFFFALKRLIRLDVRSVFPDAPLCCGFEGKLNITSGFVSPMHGSYRLCLVNILGKAYALKPLDISLDVDEHSHFSASMKELSRDDVTRITKILKMRLED